jgi:hypothetical protein
MTTFTATSASGKSYTRKTAKTYTHAVIVAFENGYTKVSFASSADLAQKFANGVRNSYIKFTTEIVEVTAN